MVDRPVGFGVKVRCVGGGSVLGWALEEAGPHGF